MDRILISGGDSFIYGTGLSDTNEHRWQHSNLTWPALLAQSQDRRYHCTACAGYSNTAISRTVMLACDQYRDQDIFVVVGWTFLNRYELRFAYDPWLKPQGNPAFQRWHNFNKKDLDRSDSHFSSSKQAVLKFLDDFYRHVGHDDVYEYYITLKEIVFLQNYLKQNNIPYLFTLMHNFFRKQINEENVNCLLQQIDMKPWFFFPPLQGFVEWSKDYPKYEEHPTDVAHRDAWRLVSEFLDTKTS